MPRLSPEASLSPALAVFAVAAIAFLVSAPVAAPAWAQTAGETPQDETVLFTDDDQAMNAAIDASRRAFGAFIRIMRENPRARPMLKVVLDTPSGGRAHVWMQVTDIRGDEWIGLLANTGAPGDGYTAGDEHAAPFDRVSDWMIFAPPHDTGPIFGAYTLRVIIERNPGSVPADFQDRLQPLARE